MNRRRFMKAVATGAIAATGIGAMTAKADSKQPKPVDITMQRGVDFETTEVTIHDTLGLPAAIDKELAVRCINNADRVTMLSHYGQVDEIGPKDGFRRFKSRAGHRTIRIEWDEWIIIGPPVRKAGYDPLTCLSEKERATMVEYCGRCEKK